MKENQHVYVVTNPELGWDRVVGVFTASDEDIVYEYLCMEGYGENYTQENLESTKRYYVVDIKRLQPIYSKEEIRDQKIDEILKNE
jgi:hypothetical protein